MRITRSWLRYALTLIAVLVPTAFMLAAVPPVAAQRLAPAAESIPAAPGVPAAHGVGVVSSSPAHVPNKAASNFRPSGTSWPAAGSGVMSLPATVPPGVPKIAAVRLARQPGVLPPLAQATGLPVVAGATGSGSSPAAVQVAVLAHSAATAIGVRGVVFTAEAQGAGGGPVRIGLNYAGFADVSGGNYGLSLGLEELPSCALSTPQLAACQKGQPLPFVNDAATKTVVAPVQLPDGGPTSSGQVVLALQPTSSVDGGAAGSYNATTLRPSGTWAAGGSTGSFTYSYPMAVPSSAGGLDPQVGLSYDSGSVDGQTASTQAQSSWVGDGWSTPASFIEQSFKSCQDNPEGSASPVVTSDDCYDGPVLTLSLNGSSTPLVCPVPFSYTQDSTCTAANDTGEVITHHVKSSNGQGTQFTDYWTETTRDGTTYNFGLNQLPGWQSGKPTTNSVDWVPVFSAHSGDPCYNISGSGFTDSVCKMAYRWNLDYVKDLHNNAMAYYYDQDTNAYMEDGQTGAVSYIRDSHLSYIDYGFADNHAYDTTIADQVLFTTGDRCFAGASNCDPISSHAANWGDVPWATEHCDVGATATNCKVVAPSFWSTVALSSVSTGQTCKAPDSSGNSTCTAQADSWALSQSLPDPGDGTSPTLWLQSVTRTGLDTTAGGGSAPKQTVSFQSGSGPLPNRVSQFNGASLNRFRIRGITTEAGAQISVNYEIPYACPSTRPDPANNTKSCFPEYWGSFPPPPTGTQGPDWFNKYAVQSVSVADTYGGSPGLSMSYHYAGAAWHFDDNEVVKSKDRTYGQWRGYQDVQTFVGSGGTNDPQTETETTYYQGMSLDNNTTDVTLPDSQNKQHEDTNQLAGDVLESTTYTYSGGPVDHSTIDSYWVSAAVATRDRSNVGLANDPLTANFSGQVEEWSRQAITDTSTTTWRKTETDTTYNTNLSSSTAGLPLFIFAHGDLSDTSQARCTSITYASPNTNLNLAGLPAETEVDALACGGSNPGGLSIPGNGQVNALAAPSGRATANIVSDTRIFYNNATLAATWPQTANPTWPQVAPGNGDVSVTRQATAYDSTGTATSWQTSSTTLYNPAGQVVQTYDGNGGKNGSTYTPTKTSYSYDSDGNVTGTTVTNPLGQPPVSTTYDPLRGLPLSTTDANGFTTTMRYDVLGRVTSVWEYGRATTTPANYIFTYDLSNSSPSQVTTQKLDDAGGYVTSVELLDSLLRPRQNQTPTPQGGSLVTDHLYDNHGWQWKTNTSWWNSGENPGTCPTTTPPTTPPCLWSIVDSQVPNQTVTQFDGMGRPVIATSYNDSNVVSTAYTLYTGDTVTTITAAGATPSVSAITAGGATPTTVTTDALGRQTELDSYTTAPAVTTGTNAGGFPTVSLTGGTSQATTYAYETRGELSAITDAATGEHWTRSYNSLGQITTSTDPNAGQTTQYTYDADGHLLSSQDALAHTISYTYDALGRKTGEYDGPSNTSQAIAQWAYDSATNPLSSTAVTNPIGQMTTQTSYDAAGKPYIFQANGFNQFGDSTGETVSIAATTATGALGTPNCSATAHTGCYILSHYYSTTAGLPLADTYPASPLGTGQSTPALPAENVTHGYIPGFDMPKYLSSNLAAYAQSITWNAFFQVAQEELGSTTAGDNAFITNTYDPHTGLLTDSNVQNTGVQSSTPYDDTSYTYDPAGLITSQQDVRAITAQSLSQTELQCYTYSLLDQLSTAWTTNGTHPCSAAPSTGSTGTVGDGVSGGAYWTSWTFNALGEPQTQTQHSVTGGTNTVTTDTYNQNGKSQPDTLTTAATTGPGAGTNTYTYDPAGNTLTRNLSSGNQALTWTDDGKLATDTVTNSTTCKTGCTTSYVYDAGGNLLLQEDPSQTTLYLFGEQLVLNTGTGQVTGTRFIPLPGGGTAVRTGASTSYYFEVGDQHGTSLLTLDHNVQNPIWRQFTPYGASRGTAPSSWPDTNAFLGKPTDSNTGLDIVGARHYDPTLGRFISVDPVLKATTPQELNGYTYAADDPVSSGDPTGLGGECITQNYCYHPPTQTPPTQTNPTGSTNSTGSNFPTGAPNDHLAPGPVSCDAACVVQVLRTVRNHEAQATTASSHHSCGWFSSWSCFWHHTAHWANETFVAPNVAAWHLIEKHWAGISQTLGLVALGVCIFASAGACMVVGVAISVANYVVAGAQGQGWGGDNAVGLVSGVGLSLLGGDAAASEMHSAEQFWKETMFSDMSSFRYPEPAPLKPMFIPRGNGGFYVKPPEFVPTNWMGLTRTTQPINWTMYGMLRGQQLGYNVAHAVDGWNGGFICTYPQPSNC